MTRETAKIKVEQLDNYLSHACQDYGERDHEAMMMAIKALEQEPTPNLGVDCVSRKAVLDAIDSKAWEFCDYLISKGRNDEQKPVSHFADNLRECVREELPSVTPQEQQAFTWCTDCREYDQEKHCCHRYSKVIRNTVTEIRQKPVLDKINKMKSEIADSLEFWDYSPNNNPLARDMLETITNFWGDIKAETEET